MKQLKKFSALLMCLFALGFTACGGGDDDDNGGASGGSTTQFEIDDLYGGWKYESGDECTVYHFASDNGGIIVKNADSKNYDRSDIIYTVKYMAEENVTTLTIIAGESSKKEYTIFLLNDQKLVLEDGEKSLTLKRYTGNIDEDYPVKVAPEHEAVDLGLSVKWATCNIGAESPEEYGDYFAWGETTTKSEYTEENCKTLGENKYNIGDISGNPEYDTATANWGGSWRMPTYAEMQELVDNCTWKWATQGGRNGYKVTSKINGNSIFLPAAGYRKGSSLSNVGSSGEYWNSRPAGSRAQGAYNLYFVSDGYYHDWVGRAYGRSVRPVTE